MAFFSHLPERPLNRPFGHNCSGLLPPSGTFFLAPGLFAFLPLNLLPSNASRPFSRRCPAPPRPPHLHPAHAPPPPQEAGHVLPPPGRLVRHLPPPLRPPFLPLPPRRPLAHRPTPDLQGRRPDTHGLRPQGTA